MLENKRILNEELLGYMAFWDELESKQERHNTLSVMKGCNLAVLWPAEDTTVSGGDWSSSKWLLTCRLDTELPSSPSTCEDLKGNILVDMP